MEGSRALGHEDLGEPRDLGGSWDLQSWTKYLKQGIQSNWTRQENFDIYFCVVFYCYYQSLISAKETGYYAVSLPKFDFF